jgi:trk system potassium uptake protein
MRATSLLALIILMFIGASPGGTGEGIKTTTFGAIVLDAVAVLRGGDDAVAWKRRLSQQTVRRAVVITSLALLLVALDLLILTVTERALFLQLLFEVPSAFATVGLSTGITGSLTVVGKWLNAIGGGGSTIALILAVPGIIAFAIALTVAIAWCLWLEAGR